MDKRNAAELDAITKALLGEKTIRKGSLQIRLQTTAEEPASFENNTTVYTCGFCQNVVLENTFNFCPHCGRKVVWDGVASRLLTAEFARGRGRRLQH